MKSLALFFIILVIAVPAIAQIELVSDNYFPADLEFGEFKSIASENRITDPSGLTGVKNGKLFAYVGFDNYSQRTYTLENSKILSIEVVSLIDARAAFSLLTLLRTTDIQKGPPGDAFASDSGRIIFCHGRRWVRITGDEIPDTLLHRVAVSVSNRMGMPDYKLPSLISHFPKTGMDISLASTSPRHPAQQVPLGLIQILINSGP